MNQILVRVKGREPLHHPHQHLLHKLIKGSSGRLYSAIEMASATKFSYQRLQNEGGFEEDAEEEAAFRRMRNSSKTRKLNAKKRPRIRIAGLKRFIKRRKDGLFSALGIWSRALKRLKESQAHMGELFAGNYLFTQVSPSPLKSGDKNVMHHPL